MMTLKSTKEKLRQLRDSAEVGHRYTKECKEDFDFLCNVASRHPDFSKHVGCVDSILAFEIARNDHYGNKEYIIVDHSGARVKISMMKVALSGKLKTPKENLDAAMRYACYESSELYAALSPHVCVRCGADGDIEIDHVTPMAVLKSDFLATVAKVPTKFEQLSDGRFVFLPEDADFRSDWVAYHDTHTSLQALCKRCHRQKSKEDATCI